MPALTSLAAALAAGTLAGGFYLVGLGHSLWGIFLVACCPLPIYVVALGRGSLAAGLASVLAVLGVMAFGGLLPASVFSVAFAIPAFLLGHLAAEPAGGTPEEPVWNSASTLARALVILGLAQVALAAAALSLSDAGLVGTVRNNLGVVADWLYGARRGHGTETAQAVAEIVAFWDSLVLGSILAAVLISHAALGALGQGLVRSFARPRRPAPAFWQLRLPPWMPLSAAALGAAVLALDVLAPADGGLAEFLVHLLTGFLLVLCAGFLLQGLAVLHALTRGMFLQPVILLVSYVVVLIFQPFGALAFAAVGFAEPWAGFRERFGVACDATETE